MPRSVPLRVVLVATATLACGPGRPAIPDPPRPEFLETFAPGAVEHIEGALARLAEDPADDERWAELGMVYNAERQRGLAAECFAVAATLGPRNPRWPYYESIALSRTGELDAALAAMQRSLALEPEYAPSHARLGRLHMELGDMELARKAFERATELDSSYPGGWLGLANVALQLDDDERAIEILERLCAEDPEDLTFRQMLALARREGGGAADPASDQTLGEEELQVWNDPWELETRRFQRIPPLLLVSRMISRGEYQQALETLQAEREKGASLDETALLFASALEGLGRAKEALVEVERSLAVVPESTPALLIRARLLDDLGDLEGTVATFEILCRLNPEEGGMFAAAGAKLAALERHGAAVASLRKAIELGVDDFGLRSMLASSLYALKRWDEAREVFEGLLEEHPEDADTWVRYATVCTRCNRLQEAERALDRGEQLGAADEAVAAVREKIRLIRERRERTGPGE